MPVRSTYDTLLHFYAKARKQFPSLYCALYPMPFYIVHSFSFVRENPLSVGISERNVIGSLRLIATISTFVQILTGRII